MAAKKRTSSSSSSSSVASNSSAKSSSSVEASEVAYNDFRRPSVKRARKIDSKAPYYQLLSITEENNIKREVEGGKNVLHWFRNQDLRIQDNKGLHAADKFAKETGGLLITAIVFAPSELERHGVGAAKADFLLRTIKEMKRELNDINVPLVVISSEETGRVSVSDLITKFVSENSIGHVTANIEYEIDELRRDIRVNGLLSEEGVGFELHHDQTVLEPLSVATQSGKPHRVFTPYFRAWLDEINSNADLYALIPNIVGNEKGTSSKLKGLFESEVPALPDTFARPGEIDLKKLAKLWPAGHTKGQERMKKFLKQKVWEYGDKRSEPAADCCSRMSPYFSCGAVSAREAVNMSREAKENSSFAESGDGVDAWVRELVFREFYRQLTAITPHISMNLPTNLNYNEIKWEEDEEGWKKWCTGNTGMPFIDAGMRQLNAEGYMHNRLRMNVSSYLRGNLLIDYRKGERYFANSLVDWDMCNNHAGWEPSYTIFNPVAQAEKLDKDGEYIHKWVPELRSLTGKELFDPYNRLNKEEFSKLGYSAPHVDFVKSKERCVERYKAGVRDGKSLKEEED